MNYRPVSHVVPFYHSPGHSWHIEPSPRHPRCCPPGTSEAGPLVEGHYSLSVWMCNCGKNRHSARLSYWFREIMTQFTFNVIGCLIAKCMVLTGCLTCVFVCACDITTMEANCEYIFTIPRL